MSGSESAYWALYINPVFRAVDFVTECCYLELIAQGSFLVLWKKQPHLNFINCRTGRLCHMVSARPDAAEARYLLHSAYGSGCVYFAIGKGWLSKPYQPDGWFCCEASFSLYMIHQILINYAVREYSSWVNIDSMKSVVMFMLPVIAVGVILSLIMFKCFEKPMNNLLRSKDKKSVQIYSEVSDYGRPFGRLVHTFWP